MGTWRLPTSRDGNNRASGRNGERVPCRVPPRLTLAAPTPLTARPTASINPGAPHRRNGLPATSPLPSDGCGRPRLGHGCRVRRRNPHTRTGSVVDSSSHPNHPACRRRTNPGVPPSERPNDSGLPRRRRGHDAHAADDPADPPIQRATQTRGGDWWLMDQAINSAGSVQPLPLPLRHMPDWVAFPTMKLGRVISGRRRDRTGIVDHPVHTRR